MHWCRSCGKTLRNTGITLTCYNCGKEYIFNDTTGWLDEVKKTEWDKLQKSSNLFMTVKGQKFWLADGDKTVEGINEKAKKWSEKGYFYRIKHYSRYHSLFVKKKNNLINMMQKIDNK
jgi:hypothetical protein